MPPTTRAASKRHGHRKKHGHNNTRKKAKNAREDLYFPLLELPSELRNRIYDFAKEMEYHEQTEVPFFTKSSRTTKAWNRPGRQFFALTQVCKQIRVEYRPIWLRDSSIRIQIQDVSNFMIDYRFWADNYQNGPRWLLISVDHERDNVEHVLSDLSCLLCLRASCTTSKIEFVCRRLVDWDLELMECHECGDYHDIDDVVEETEKDYRYLDALNELLEDNNKCWLGGFYNDATLLRNMNVECTFHRVAKKLTLYIRFNNGFAPPGFAKQTMYTGAFQCLKDMGLLNLNMCDMFDFVVGEATGKFVRDSSDAGLFVPTYDQIEISADMDPED